MRTLTVSAAGFTIYPDDLHLDDIVEIVRHRRPVFLSSDPEFRTKIRRGRRVLEDKLREGEVIYGVLAFRRHRTQKVGVRCLQMLD